MQLHRDTLSFLAGPSQAPRRSLKLHGVNSMFPSIVTTWIRLPELGQFFSVTQSWKASMRNAKGVQEPESASGMSCLFLGSTAMAAAWPQAAVLPCEVLAELMDSTLGHALAGHPRSPIQGGLGTLQG